MKAAETALRRTAEQKLATLTKDFDGKETKIKVEALFN